MNWAASCYCNYCMLVDFSDQVQYKAPIGLVSFEIFLALHFHFLDYHSSITSAEFFHSPWRNRWRILLFLLLHHFPPSSAATIIHRRHKSIKIFHKFKTTLRPNVITQFWVLHGGELYKEILGFERKFVGFAWDTDPYI